MTIHSTTVGVAEVIRHGLEPILAFSPLNELPVIRIEKWIAIIAKIMKSKISFFRLS